MKITYRGYELEVKRENCLGGWSQLYFSAYPVDANKPVLADGFSDTSDTVKTYMQILRERVDDYYQHPEDYGED